MENRQQTQNTSREQDEGCVTWTVAEILEHYNAGLFGIPHFQRGLVWDDAMLGDLLESLYFDTPCGAIVLWKLENGLDDYGLPIGPHAIAERVRYLLVDGQQRIRSLGRVNGLLEAFRSHGNDENTDEPQVWCVNLARTEEFEELVKQGRELPLFSLRADPGHRRYAQSTRRILGYNFIPVRELAIFENLESWTRRETYLSEGLRSKEQSHLEAKLLAVRDKLSKILERKLFVRILRADFLEVVRVYIRINSAGKRVEAEERALATLSALDPETNQSETNQRLREMFEVVHGPDADSHDAIQERDMRLGRHPERTLGFKFLMRAFVQACAQHSNFSADAASLSFDAVDRDSFRKVFAGDDAAPRRAKVWNSARQAVACVARVLRNELFCDDFRFVPDAASLIPVMQLLIRFPELAGDPSVPSSQHYDPVVAALIFRAFLEGPRDPYKVAEEVRQSNEPLTEIVGTVCKKFCDRRSDNPSDMKWLEKQLEESNSIQNRYVLLLYWLIRRKRAKDFSYQNLPGKTCKGLLPGEERKVKKSEEPEKQHIIPLSKIASNLEDSHNRARQGRAHNIGNLTYISSALNFDLSDEFINPAHDDDNNLRAHMLRADGNGDPLEKYNKIKRLENFNQKTVESPFLEFCNKRCTVIAHAFLEWLDDLETSARGVDLGGARSIVPALVERKFLDLADTIRSRIREAESPDHHLEDLLLRLVESIERGVKQRRITVRRAPLKDQNQSADRFAVDVRCVDAGDGERGKKRFQRILVLYVDSMVMKIELLNEDMRPAFEDLLELLGQSAGSKQARIGIDKARRVSADDIATQFALLLNAAESHLHTAERDPGA